MIDVDVTTDNQTGLAGMISGLNAQLPFAYSRGLNNLANKAQDAIKASLPGRFTLRRADFIKNTIYRKPGQDFATKTNLAATVRVNPDRDFLSKFEDDTVKTGDGHKLAVPVFRQQSPQTIIGASDPLNIKMLMAAINAGHGKTFKTRVSKGQLQVKVQQETVFLVKNAKGTFVVQRTGTGTRVLYVFERSVPIKPDLHFEETAMAAVLESSDDMFAEALDYAMETAR